MGGCKYHSLDMVQLQRRNESPGDERRAALVTLRRSKGMAGHTMVHGDLPAGQHLRSESVVATLSWQTLAAAKMSSVPEAMPALPVPPDEEDKLMQPAVNRQPQSNAARECSEEPTVRPTLAADA
jgi:hypothetical protein